MSLLGLTEKLTSKRMRNPNWTDDEIFRLLELLQEKEVLRFMADNRTRHVYHYISSKLTEEGREKTPLQCKVKLKNLKFHWRTVAERVPFLESADLENEADMLTLIHECEKNGISSFNVRHVRMLKRFLDGLSAMRCGLTIPQRLTDETPTLPFTAPFNNDDDIASHQSGSFGEDITGESFAGTLIKSEVDLDQTKDCHDELNISEDISEKDDDPLNFTAEDSNSDEAPDNSRTPTIEKVESLKRKVESNTHYLWLRDNLFESKQLQKAKKMKSSNGTSTSCAAISGLTKLSPTIKSKAVTEPSMSEAAVTRRAVVNSKAVTETANNAASSSSLTVKPSVGTSSGNKKAAASDCQLTSLSIAKLHMEMADKFLTMQQESSQKAIQWEQEQLKLEQSFLEDWRQQQKVQQEQWLTQQQQLIHKWRSEQREHEHRMLTMFTTFLTETSKMMLEASTTTKKD